MYSPYGPHCLYTVSVPVQWCTLPLPLPSRHKLLNIQETRDFLLVWRPVSSWLSFQARCMTFDLSFSKTCAKLGGHKTVSGTGHTTRNLWYIFSWVFPRRLNIKSRRFGTLCGFHLHRWVGEDGTDRVFRNVGF
jgi:hypothetical protein